MSEQPRRHLPVSEKVAAVARSTSPNENIAGQMVRWPNAVSGHVTGFAVKYGVFSPGHGPFGHLRSPPRNGASENGYQIEAFRAPITRHVSPVSAKRSRGRAPRLKRQLVLGRLGTGLTHRGDWRATGEWPAPNP